ncbi:MAG TPA: hypothetical protein VND22_09445 [Actinomycetota bacterium]|nr:hypothetical protein [Actinomycetota bacterium]
MEASELLAIQLNGIGQILNRLAAEVDVETSRKRAFPGASLIGFTLWHLARTVDWAVNSMIRGALEAAFDFDFQGAADPRISQIGFGIQLHEADAIAEATTPAAVARYFELVLADANRWLETNPDLSFVPDALTHQPDFPGYRTDFYLEEVASYKEGDWTALQILDGPAIEHVRGHFGEIDVLRQILG